MSKRDRHRQKKERQENATAGPTEGDPQENTAATPPGPPHVLRPRGGSSGGGFRIAAATPAEPQRSGPAPAGKGGGVYIEDGAPPIYMDGWSNDVRGGITGDGGPVQVSGSFDHTPVADGGNITYMRYLRIGKNAHPPS